MTENRQNMISTHPSESLIITKYGYISLMGLVKAAVMTVLASRHFLNSIAIPSMFGSRFTPCGTSSTALKRKFPNQKRSFLK